MRILDFADSFTSNVAPTSVAFAASSVAVTPFTGLVSTNAQAAFVEVVGDINAITSGAVSSSTANAIVRRDANSNFAVNNVNEAFQTIATAAGTTTLTVASAPLIQFTGTTTQTVVMPDATTETAGAQFQIFNRSAGAVTVNANGGTLLQVMAAGSQCVFTCASIGSAAGVWDLSYTPSGASTVTLTGAQTLTNKTIGDSLTLSEISTPGAPSAGQLKVYAKSDNNLYTQNSSGSETQVGSGSGGSKNYLGTVNGVNGNGNFELGVAGGWALGTIGTLTNKLPTGTPTFGSGYNIGTSFSVVGTGQLAGSYSGQLAFSAASTVGDMLASPVFTIDKEDQAKVLTFKFYYSATVGSSTANWSGTSSNSFACAVYDSVSGAFLGQSANFGMTQSSGVGICTGTFQTNSNTTGLRFVIYCANATTGACTILVDDISVGPQTAPVGYSGNDWQTYTPTISNLGAGSTTLAVGKWRKLGDSVHIMFSFTKDTTAGTGASAVSISLPTGLTIDSTKLPDTSTKISFGSANVFTTQFYTATVGCDNVSYTTLKLITTGGTTFLTGAQMVASSDAFGEAIVPIVGWSSNVQMSSDTDTRVVEFCGSQTASASLSTTPGTLLSFNALTDTHGAWNGTNAYKIPVSGVYTLSCVAPVISNSGLVNVFTNYYVNTSTSLATITYTTLPATGACLSIPTTYTGFFSAGQTVSFGIWSTTGSASLNGTTNGASVLFSITRLSGPSVIAATESVNARYTNTAGTTIGTSYTLIPFATKDYDSHGIWTGSQYNVGVSGKFSVVAQLQTAALTLTVTQGFGVAVYKNGTLFSELNLVPGTGSAFNYRCGGADDINCLAGDYLQIYASSSVATTLIATAGCNRLSIKRTGN